jgi:hypothetical protein
VSGSSPAASGVGQGAVSDTMPLLPRGRANTFSDHPSLRRTLPTREPNVRTGAHSAAVMLLSVLLLGVGEIQAQGAGDARQAVTPVVPDAVPRPVARTVRATGAIRIDGRVDEAAWADAAVIDRFVQSRPNLGHPATQRTEVRFLHDGEYLYIAALCFDEEAHRLTTPSLERDFASNNSDVFGVALDTYHDRRNGFMFLVNPHGALKDVQLFDDSRSENGAWEGPIDVRTEIQDWGWSVEMAIPLSTLRFDPRTDPQVWGLQILRRVRRDNEDSFWAPLDRRDQIHRMSKAGTLEGLGRVQAGRNLSVKPYLLGGTTSGTRLGEPYRGGEADAGGDLKFGLTPALSLDLTWRTDFSQVEVDDEQVNLTRFSLFFPEKREFFVENSGTFAFGDELSRGYRTGSGLRDFTLFHSRRIGLTDDGQPIPILGGGRLTGRAGGVELGALNMQTRSHGEAPAENFSVLRVRRPLFGSSDIGALAVNRQATGGGLTAQRDVGVDGSFRFQDHLIVHTYLARTGGDRGEGSPVAARLAAGWRDPLWNVSGFVKQVGEAFEPAVGFIRRTGVRHSYGTVGLHPRTPLRQVQEVNPFVEAHFITGPSGAL